MIFCAKRGTTHEEQCHKTRHHKCDPRNGAAPPRLVLRVPMHRQAPVALAARRKTRELSVGLNRPRRAPFGGAPAHYCRDSRMPSGLFLEPGGGVLRRTPAATMPHAVESADVEVPSPAPEGKIYSSPLPQGVLQERLLVELGGAEGPRCNERSSPRRRWRALAPCSPPPGCSAPRPRSPARASRRACLQCRPANAHS